MMQEKATQILGPNGAMISGSKSGYIQRNPKNMAIFNANIIAMGAKPDKIWYGDLDVTLSLEKLKTLAEAIGTEVRVLREMDARFEYDEKPIVGKFVIKVQPDGSYELGNFEKDYYLHESLTRKEDE
jgi:hypothetical protein